MTKLGGRCTVPKSRLSSNSGVMGANPHVALGYDVGKISEGRLVSSLLSYTYSIFIPPEVCSQVRGGGCSNGSQLFNTLQRRVRRAHRGRQ